VRRLGRRQGELESWINANDGTGLLVVNAVKNSTVKLRQIDEAIEQAKDSSDQQARLNKERDLLVLQNQLNLARAIGFEIEKQTVQEELLETVARLQLASKQLAVASEHVELTKQDIDNDGDAFRYGCEPCPNCAALDTIYRSHDSGSSKYIGSPDSIDHLRLYGRYMIYKTLDEHGIVIAFPQRDVHIDTSQPLEVRVLADMPGKVSVKG
jgi:hypothetical protein